MKKAIILSTFFIANIFSQVTFADLHCTPCALYVRHQVDKPGAGDVLDPRGEHASKVIGDLLANITRFNSLANQANKKANLPNTINCCAFKHIWAQTTGKPLETAANFATKIGIPFSQQPGSPNLLPPAPKGKDMGYTGLFKKNQMPKPTDGSIIVVLREESLNNLLPQLVNDGRNKAKISTIGQVVFPMFYLFYNLQGDGTYANLNLYLQKYTFPNNVTGQCVTNLLNSKWGPKDLMLIDSLQADPSHNDVFDPKKCGTP